MQASSFTQSVDFKRPHKLLNTANPKFCGTLVYEYLDTAERISVPNIWYNQGFQMRVAAVRYEAQKNIERAVQFETSTPYNMTEAMAQNIAKRYRERAARINAEADRMFAAGVEDYPTAASQMALNYGPNVF